MSRGKHLLFLYPLENEETRASNQENALIGGVRGLESSLLYIASHVHQHCPDTRISYLDARFEPEPFENVVLDFIDLEHVSHVGIACYSHQYLGTCSLARAIKNHRPDVLVIAGGFHPTIMPRDFIYTGSPFDFIVRGEGEIPVVQILQDHYKVASRPVEIQVRDPISLLNHHPVDFTLFDRYKNKFDHSSIALNFSRGCIYNCSFCISRESTCHLKSYRSLPLETIRKQVRIIEDEGVKVLTLQDPLFGGDKGHFDKILEIIGQKNRPYKVKLEMHVDLVNSRVLNRLIEAKIDLTVGFESASSQMLFLMNKTRNPRSYVDKSRQIIKHFDGTSQELTLNILFGHPGESRTTLQETFFFLNQASPWMNNVLPKFSLFRLYPGTPVHEHASFFESWLGTRFFMKDWWYHDIDHTIAPCLIDPSASLTFKGGIEHFMALLREYFATSILPNRSLNPVYKFFFSKQLARVSATYEKFAQKAFSMRDAQHEENLISCTFLK